MIKIENLVSGYGNIEILHMISMHVSLGEIVTIIGPNGSGKSTIFKTIFGLIKPQKGRIYFDNENITNMDPTIIVRKGLSYVPQGRSIFPNLSVLDNLEMGAYIRNDEEVQEDIEGIFNLFPILKERMNSKAYVLSGGEQQMLVIGRALMLKPKMLMLDEPTLGLAPKLVEMIFNKLLEINKSGITLLIIEQNARKALQLANRAYVLDLGEIKFEGTGENVLKNENVRKLYLGGEI